MNYTLNNQKTSSHLHSAVPSALASEKGDSAVGTLTNYKKVVDIRKNAHYGVTAFDLEVVNLKLKSQREFLEDSYLYDRINKNRIPLKELLVSANHTPQRYYSEIQNRINTLTKVAKERDLVPVFMTLTLPSEFHRYKHIKNELYHNPKFNMTEPKEAVKVLTKMFAKLRHDRSLKELSKEHRIYFRVNEPHKDGTPHTHILMFIPRTQVTKVKIAFKRLFDTKANDIQTDIKNATSYVMKYINKTLPLSKKEKLTKKERHLNAVKRDDKKRATFLEKQDVLKSTETTPNDLQVV